MYHTNLLSANLIGIRNNAESCWFVIGELALATQAQSLERPAKKQ
jgi:hypothetical protein